MFRGATYLPLLSGLETICALPLVGSGDMKQFLENGSSLVASIGGNDSGYATSQPGCGPIME